MANTVFFAWQLDTPSAQNKQFVWQALVDATARIAGDKTPEQAPRPESDTGGLPGSPNIVETIFRRIRECSIFVADLTFVGVAPSGKKLPNPNVLIELGYAARSVSWDRTILVINQAYGEARDLPFDILQHRWPIEYRASEQTKSIDRKRSELADDLYAALNECEAHALQRADEMATAMDTECLAYIAAHESEEQIPMQMYGRNLAGQVGQLTLDLVIRRLMQLGALEVTAKRTGIGYRWTYDGRRMIDRLNATTPTLLQTMRDLVAKADK